MGDEARERARKAFEENFKALYDFVILRLPGEREEAEDIVQEVFAAMSEGLPAFRGGSSLRTWLCAIARRKIADHYRAATRARKRAQIARTDESDDARFCVDLPLLADEEAERVRSCLARLIPEARYALLMRHVDRFSIAEIARVLGKSPKATESLLHRARTAFASFFEEESQR